MIVIRHPYAFFDVREASDRRYFAGQPAWPSALPSSRHPLSKMRASTVAQPNNVAFPCIVNDTSRQTSTRSRQQIIYRSILLCGHFRGFQKIMPDNNDRAKWLSTIPGAPMETTLCRRHSSYCTLINNRSWSNIHRIFESIVRQDRVWEEVWSFIASPCYNVAANNRSKLLATELFPLIICSYARINDWGI